MRIRGYEISPTYEAADLVVVNTCGFIDSAIDESLEAIGEALEQNGKVIVTGCLGANPAAHPRAPSAGAGGHRTARVRGRARRPCTSTCRRRTIRSSTCVPPQGIRLTPRHYAYLKISEGCNNKCSFCIIPSLRGRLASRPIDEVLREGERLVAAGVKELLVISQDTSAYGVGHPVPRRHAGATSSTKPASSTWRADSARSASGCACTTCIPIRMWTT